MTPPLCLFCEYRPSALKITVYLKALTENLLDEWQEAGPGQPKESLGRGSRKGEGTLTSSQGSPGRSTPEAGSRSDRFLPEPYTMVVRQKCAGADIEQEEKY